MMKSEKFIINKDIQLTLGYKDASWLCSSTATDSSGNLTQNQNNCSEFFLKDE